MGRRGAGGWDWPHIVVLDPYNSGLALARRMVRLGARVTLLTEAGYDFVTRSRGVESLTLPFADGEPWLERLCELAAGSSQLALIPATDRTSRLLVRAADRLPVNAFAFERADSRHLALMNKSDADAIARDAGLSVPWTRRLGAMRELWQASQEAPWPCVVKPVYSHEWRARFGEVRVFLAHDAQQAAARLQAPLDLGMEMLLSEYIPGGDENVEEAIVVRLADGSYPVQFGCRKLRQYPPGFGITSVGEASPLPETTALARRILEHAGFVGVAGVEVKRHQETGERWFIEVNVRLPGQWGLGDAAGAQASPRLIASLMGRPLGPQPPARTGVRMVLPDIDLLAVRPQLLALPAWRRPARALKLVRAYAGAREFGMFDVRDPGPMLALLADFIRRRGTRIFGAAAARRRSAGRS